MVVGTPIGGQPSLQLGITAPFSFGIIDSALLVANLWRQFDHIANSGDLARGS